MYVSVAVEMCGSLGPQTKAFFKLWGWRLRSASSDVNSHQHLFQRISVTVRGNMASVMGTLSLVLQSVAWKFFGGVCVAYSECVFIKIKKVLVFLFCIMLQCILF